MSDWVTSLSQDCPLITGMCSLRGSGASLQGAGVVKPRKEEKSPNR